MLFTLPFGVLFCMKCEKVQRFPFEEVFVSLVNMLSQGSVVLSRCVVATGKLEWP